MSDATRDIRDVIFEALRAALPADRQVTDETHIIDDLGLDSVAVMDFVMEIEDRLDISVPLDRIAEVQTVGDLVAVVRQLKGGA